MSNILEIKDTLKQEDFSTVKGRVTILTKDPVTGEVVDTYNNNNTITLQIRPTMMKLLGAFGNIKVAYKQGDSAWSHVPDTGVITGMTTEDLSVQVVPTTLPYVSHIGFGTGTQDPTIFDTSLEAPINNGEKLLAAAPTISADGLRVTYSAIVDKDELNGVTITEAVLMTTAGVVIARALIGSYSKPNGMMFEFYWQIGYVG